MVRAIYCRSLSVGGALIRAASWWEQWSHCGLLTPDGTVINARAFHGVLRADLVDDLAEVQAQLGQAFLRDLDEDLLVLHAKQFDLGHVRHAQQLAAFVHDDHRRIGRRG